MSAKRTLDSAVTIPREAIKLEWHPTMRVAPSRGEINYRRFKIEKFHSTALFIIYISAKKFGQSACAPAVAAAPRFMPNRRDN